MFVLASNAGFSNIFDIHIHLWPPHKFSSYTFHSRAPWMVAMQFIENLCLVFLGNYNSTAP